MKQHFYKSFGKQYSPRGFIKFLCRRSVGFYSQAILVFLMKESKKRRRKQLGKLMAVSFTAGQFARCPALNEPPDSPLFFLSHSILGQLELIRKSLIIYDESEHCFCSLKAQQTHFWLHFSMLCFQKENCYGSWSRLINIHNKIGTREFKVWIIEKSG